MFISKHFLLKWQLYKRQIKSFVCDMCFVNYTIHNRINNSITMHSWSNTSSHNLTFHHNEHISTHNWLLWPFVADCFQVACYNKHHFTQIKVFTGNLNILLQSRGHRGRIYNLPPTAILHIGASLTIREMFLWFQYHQCLIAKSHFREKKIICWRELWQ